MNNDPWIRRLAVSAVIMMLISFASATAVGAQVLEAVPRDADPNIVLLLFGFFVAMLAINATVVVAVLASVRTLRKEMNARFERLEDKFDERLGGLEGKQGRLAEKVDNNHREVQADIRHLISAAYYMAGSSPASATNDTKGGGALALLERAGMLPPVSSSAAESSSVPPTTVATTTSE